MSIIPFKNFMSTLLNWKCHDIYYVTLVTVVMTFTWPSYRWERRVYLYYIYTCDEVCLQVTDTSQVDQHFLLDTSTHTPIYRNAKLAIHYLSPSWPHELFMRSGQIEVSHWPFVDMLSELNYNQYAWWPVVVTHCSITLVYSNTLDTVRYTVNLRH